MTINDIKKYYKSGYNLARQTDFCRRTWVNWQRMGYIPIQSQVRLEALTYGKLKANLKHAKPH